VAADSRRARDGRFLEKVGFYNPLREPIELELDMERIRVLVAEGARLSESVTHLVRHQERTAPTVASS
jgi:small subunit ribosomal protein S16